LFISLLDVNLAGLRRKPQPKDKFQDMPDKTEIVPDEMRRFSEKHARPPPRPRHRSRYDWV